MLDVSDEGRLLIAECSAKAVTDAPKNGCLRRWITDSVLSGDFNSLKDVAFFFGKNDLTLSMLYPTLDFRVERYRELMKGNENTAWQILWSDMAFNWHDKQDLSILQRLAGLFDRTDDEKKAAANLLSVNSMRLDAYMPKESGNGNTLTLVNREGQTFNDVVFPTPLPQDCMEMCFIGQLVTYLGTTYINGPGVWYDRDVYDRWGGELLWEIETDEKEDAKDMTFKTPSGVNINAYEDLYGISDISEYGNWNEQDLYDVPDWAMPMEEQKTEQSAAGTYARTAGCPSSDTSCAGKIQENIFRLKYAKCAGGLLRMLTTSITDCVFTKAGTDRQSLILKKATTTMPSSSPTPCFGKQDSMPRCTFRMNGSFHG